VTYEYWYVGPELPLVLALFGFMLLAREAGYRVGRRQAGPSADPVRPQVNVVVAATLALLALLVGFSLTMAVGRYDARRQLVLTEANAIGTAHLRARLLPPPAGPELVNRLRQYVALRLDVSEDAQVLATRAEALQGEMVAMVGALARQQPPPASVDRFIDALKELMDLHERRVSAFESFVPEAVLYVLAMAALGGAFVAGYGSGLGGHHNRITTTVHAVLICLVILVIVDLDRPARGLIRVSLRSLERQAEQLASEGARTQP
jgi:hypothetical protein